MKRSEVMMKLLAMAQDFKDSFECVETVTVHEADGMLKVYFIADGPDSRQLTNDLIDETKYDVIKRDRDVISSDEGDEIEVVVWHVVVKEMVPDDVQYTHSALIRKTRAQLCYIAGVPDSTSLNKNQLIERILLANAKVKADVEPEAQPYAKVELEVGPERAGEPIPPKLQAASAPLPPHLEAWLNPGDVVRDELPIRDTARNMQLWQRLNHTRVFTKLEGVWYEVHALDVYGEEEAYGWVDGPEGTHKLTLPIDTMFTIVETDRPVRPYAMTTELYEGVRSTARLRFEFFELGPDDDYWRRISGAVAVVRTTYMSEEKPGTHTIKSELNSFHNCESIEQIESMMKLIVYAKTILENTAEALQSELMSANAEETERWREMLTKAEQSKMKHELHKQVMEVFGDMKLATLPKRWAQRIGLPVLSKQDGIGVVLPTSGWDDEEGYRYFVAYQTWPDRPVRYVDVEDVTWLDPTRYAAKVADPEVAKLLAEYAEACK